MIDWYASNTTLIQNCMIAILLALSVQVVMRIGVLSLAGIGFYGLSEYLTANLVIRDVVPAEVAILASLVVCGIGAFVLSLFLGRVRGLYLAMVTLAFVLILNVVAINGGKWTGGANGLFGVPFAVTTAHIVVVCLIGILVVWATERGAIGRACEALRTDELLATSMGIEVRKYHRANLVLSGLLGGAAGGLNVLNLGAVGPFDAGFGLAVTTLTMVIVGGRRSWLGAVIGAVLITWLPTVLSFLEGEMRNIASGALVIVMATLVPDGLLGLLTSQIRRLRAAVRRPSGRSTTKEVDDDTQLVSADR